MRKSIQKPSEERSIPAHKRIWRFVSRHLVATISVIVLAALSTIFAYYRTHQGVWIANVTVLKSQTAPVTNDLSITLNDVKERPDPPALVVMATVVYNDLPEMKISNAQEGYIVSYPKQHGYRIELIKVNATSAKFSITKNP